MHSQERTTDDIAVVDVLQLVLYPVLQPALQIVPQLWHFHFNTNVFLWWKIECILQSLICADDSTIYKQSTNMFLNYTYSNYLSLPYLS